MKRLLISALAAVSSIALASTAHASYVERLYTSTPDWAVEQNEGSPAVNDIAPGAHGGTNDEATEFEMDMGRDLRAVLELEGAATLTRAEFTALLVRHLYNDNQIDVCFWDIAPSHPPMFELLFTDVSVDHPLALELCVAMRDGLIRGYGDGSFHPSSTISVAEASKILARAYAIAPYVDGSTTTLWFQPYVDALGSRNALPTSINGLDAHITVDLAREMMDRLSTQNTWSPSRTSSELIAAWRRQNQPAPRPASPTPSVPTTPTPSSKPTSTTSKAASSASTATASQGTTPTSAPSSREKAWYEF